MTAEIYILTDIVHGKDRGNLMDRKNITVRVHTPEKVDEHIQKMKISQIYDILTKNSDNNSDKEYKRNTIGTNNIYSHK